MNYLEGLNNNYPNSHSIKESLGILARYKNELSEEQYDAIVYSLCSHALEEIENKFHIKVDIFDTNINSSIKDKIMQGACYVCEG